MLAQVSLSYKESGNCRLECQYATQQVQSIPEVPARKRWLLTCVKTTLQDNMDMIPLMMEADYKPKVRAELWCPLY